MVRGFDRQFVVWLLAACFALSGCGGGAVVVRSGFSGNHGATTGAPVPTQPKYIKYYKATLDVPGLIFRDPAHIEFWQNDNYESGLLMVMTARDLLLERYGRSGKTIIVVGHAIAGQMLIGLLRGDDLLNGPTTTGSSAVYLLNTGIMKLAQDAATGLFKLEGRNINKPLTK